MTDQNEAAANLIGMLFGTVGLGIMVISVVVMVFYLLTLQKALSRCAPENRAMNPGLVWLTLIPLFNLVWQFFVVINIAKSLAAEFQKRGLAVEEPKPGYTLGIVMCVGNLICFPVGLVCWILYWVKISGYASKLGAPAAGVPA